MSTWGNRFADQRVVGLLDKSQPGKRPLYTETINKRRFSILQGSSLKGASFTSVKQLREHIDAFLQTYNEKAKPFIWTKAKVHQRRVKGRRISEL